MHQHSIGAPFERIAIGIVAPFQDSDRGNISPDHHGPLHEVTRNLRHPQPRRINSGRCPGHQFLHLLQRPDGDAQRPGPDLRIQVDAVGSGVTGGSVKLQRLYASCQVEWWNTTFVIHTHKLPHQLHEHKSRAVIIVCRFVIAVLMKSLY